MKQRKLRSAASKYIFLALINTRVRQTKKSKENITAAYGHYGRPLHQDLTMQMFLLGRHHDRHRIRDPLRT